MATTTNVLSGDYRVTSINEAGDDNVTVNFAEVVAEGDTGNYRGGFSRTLLTADAAQFFPGQVYTVSLTKKSD